MRIKHAFLGRPLKDLLNNLVLGMAPQNKDEHNIKRDMLCEPCRFCPPTQNMNVESHRCGCVFSIAIWPTEMEVVSTRIVVVECHLSFPSCSVLFCGYHKPHVIIHYIVLYMCFGQRSEVSLTHAMDLIIRSFVTCVFLYVYFNMHIC